MYEYGNARIAALRARLLGPSALLRLEEAGSAGAFLSLLERADDWRAIVREVAPMAADPAAASEAAIERHRAARLRALPGWYPPPARELVEAVVLPLDGERLLSILRRRQGDEDPERIAATVVPGALLGAHDLARLARASGIGAALRIAVDQGLLGREAAAVALARLERSGWPAFESALMAGLEEARRRRASGRGADRARVRAMLAAGADIRRAVTAELLAGGPVVASVMDREQTLARLDALARQGRRDPLGIGAVAGYVAAVEVQAIRLRAALARASGGWSSHLMAAYHLAGIR